jgi:hypothetical protein
LVDSLKLALGLAVLDLTELEVVGACLKEPLRGDVCDGADVVLGREHKLAVEAPLRLVVYGGARMEGHHLVVLEGQVVTCFLEVSHLQEEAGKQRLTDRRVVLGVGRLPLGDLNTMLYCDA